MTNTRGFTLVDLLVGMGITGVVLAGALGVLSNHVRTHTQQDLTTAMEENLRIGMGTLADTLRGANYGVPASNLAQWVPWVTSFANNPKITTGSPAALSIASCTPLPVAVLTTAAVRGATTLTVQSAVAGQSIPQLLNAGARRLIQLDNSQTAHVVAATSSSITIDTNPATAGNQGLESAYPAGTPLCRVDVQTFSIATDAETGLPQLMLSVNDGSALRTVADGISDLRVATVTAGQTYRVTLTARTERAEPLSHTVLTRSLQSDITLRNPS